MEIKKRILKPQLQVPEILYLIGTNSAYFAYSGTSLHATVSVDMNNAEFLDPVQAKSPTEGISSLFCFSCV